MPLDLNAMLTNGGSPSNGGGAIPVNNGEGINPAALVDNLKNILSFQTNTNSLAMRPPAQVQRPDIQYSRPQGSFQSSGERKRADRQSLLHGIASTVSTFANAEAAKQTRHWENLTTRLMDATQGYNEAQQSGDKEAAQHNAQIINDLLSDKKNIKGLQKALDINLFGEGKNKDSVEQKGLMSALQKMNSDYKSGKTPLNPIAQRLMQMLPRRENINPSLAAQAELTKAGVIPTANSLVQKDTELLKVQGELTKTFAQIQQQGLNNESRQKITQMLVDSKDKATTASIIKQTYANLGRFEASKVIADATKYRADKYYQAVVDNPKWQLLKDQFSKKPGNNPVVQMYNMVDKQVKDLGKQLDTFKKGKNPDVQGIAKVTQQIEKTKRLQDLLLSTYGKNLDEATSTNADTIINGENNSTDLPPDVEQELIGILSNDDNSDDNSDK